MVVGQDAPSSLMMKPEPVPFPGEDLEEPVLAVDDAGDVDGGLVGLDRDKPRNRCPGHAYFGTAPSERFLA